MTPKFKDAFGFAPFIHAVLKDSRYRMAILLDRVGSAGGLFATPLIPVACVARAQLAYPARERLQHVLRHALRFGLPLSYMRGRVTIICGLDLRVSFNGSCRRTRRKIGSCNVQKTYSNTRTGSFFVGASIIGLVTCSNAVNGIMAGAFATELGCTIGSTRALNNGSLASPSLGQSHISFGLIVLWGGII